MEILKYNIEKMPDKVIDQTEPSGNMMKEVTWADSSYYEDYDLRPYNPDDIYQKKGNYDLFDEIRQDDQIKSVLNLKKIMVLDSGWTVESENDEIKDFFDYQFNIHLDELFERKIYNILLAFDYGFSLSETIFENAITKDFGRKFLLKKLPTRPPHTFEFDQDSKGSLINVRQDYRGTWIDIEPQKFLHYIYQKEFENPYGQSEFNLGVYRNWYSKNALIKMWMIYNERFGQPVVVAKYPQGSNQNLAKLEKMIKNIQSRSSFVIPDNYIMEYLQKSGGGESDYERAIQYFNMMIARSMLIPDLLGFSGEQVSGGSYSLGQEHFGIFWSVIEQVRREIAKLINKHIVYPLVLWNFGSSEYAEFKFSKVDEDKKLDQAKMWLEAVKTGKIIVTPEHQNHFLNVVEYPEIDEEKFEEEKKRKEEMAAAIQGGGNALQEEGKEGKQEEKPEKVNEEGKTKKESEPKAEEKQEFEKIEFYRPLTVFEKKVDFKGTEDELNSLTVDAMSDLSNVFKLSINGLVDDIRRKRIIEKSRFDQVDKLTLRHINKISLILKRHIKKAWVQGQESVDVKTFDVVQPEITLETNLDKWIEQYALMLTNVEADFILNKVKPIVIEGIKDGKGINDIVEDLNIQLAGYDFVEELSDVQKARRLETLARTFTAKAYNEAKKQTYEKTEKFIVAYQFSAILDGRTSQICQMLDKKIFDKKESKRYWPPIHPNCRSTMVPVYGFEADELPAEGDDAYVKPPVVKKGTKSDQTVIQEEGNGFLTLKRPTK